MAAIASFILRRAKEAPFMVLLFLGVWVAFVSREAGETDMSPLALFAPAAKSLHNLRFGPFILLALSIAGAVFIGATEVPRDIESRLISILLSKPVHRWQYLTGKFLGVFGLVYGMYATWVCLLFAFNRFCSPAYAHMPNYTFADNLLAGLMLAPICALAVSVSCYFEELASMILTFTYVLVAVVMGVMPVLQTFLPPALFTPFLVMYYCFPNVDYFFSVPAPIPQKLALIVYAFASSAVYLGFALPRFQQRDLS